MSERANRRQAKAKTGSLVYHIANGADNTHTATRAWEGLLDQKYNAIKKEELLQGCTTEVLRPLRNTAAAESGSGVSELGKPRILHA